MDFDKRYFNGEGYSFYHNSLANHIFRAKVVDRKPENVLEIGCARGYVIKQLENRDIKCHGLDISNYAYLTRVTDSVALWDIRETPWPIEDGQFDFCLSVGVLDLFTEEELERIIPEIHRVSKRGLHFFHIDTQPNLSVARKINQSKEWWAAKIGQEASDFRECINEAIDVSYNTGVVKLNCGCGFEMFNHGWLNLDILDLSSFAQATSSKFYSYDLRGNIPIEDNMLTAIVASRFLNQLTDDEAQQFLSECWRTLMVGGTLRLSLPDVARFDEMASQGTLGVFDEIDEDCANANTQESKLYALIGRDKSVYSFESLKEVLQNVGFSKIKLMSLGESSSKSIREETWDTYPDMSFFVEVRKLVYEV